MTLPLAGIDVVDLTSNIAAPFASAVLADLGASVVHVESPSGDDSRRMPPLLGDSSAYWHVVNRNKAVMQLDIRLEEERARLRELLSSADVFVTNLRPGKLAKYGLDAAHVTADHPRLIHAALSAYGDAGEERDRAGYDAILQARTGIAHVTGTSDGPPVRAGVSILDVGSGMWLALGVLAALLKRESTGVGGAVSTSLFETGVAWVNYHVAAHDVSGAPSGRLGSGHPAFSPYGIFPTADRDVCLGVGGDELFRRLCIALDAPTLADDPRFVSNADRVAHDTELRHALERILVRQSADDIVARLMAHDVPCDVVQSPEALMADPQVAATGMMLEEPVDGHEPLRFPGLPLRFDGKRPQVRALGSVPGGVPQVD